MNLSETLQILAVAIGIIVAVSVLIGNIFYVLRSKTSKLQKENIEQQDIQINQLQRDNEICTNNYNSLKGEFRELKGTVNTLRDIPLHEIKDGIKSIIITNGKILDTLKAQAAPVRQVKRDLKETK